MGTCSYVLTGTHQGMTETFGSTCHGAVRFEFCRLNRFVPSFYSNTFYREELYLGPNLGEI